MFPALRLTFVPVAIAVCIAAVKPVWAEDAEQARAALAAALKDTKITLQEGLKASEREGKPISAKFEIEDGKLQLSVYTMKENSYAEVVVDPQSGSIAKVEKITEAKDEDFEHAVQQKWPMQKANRSLLAATENAVNANAGYRAVSIVPWLKEGQPAAEVTLLQGETFKKVSETLE
jgi:hypothetical protein